MAPETVGEALQRASLRLSEARVEQAREDAEIMLAHLLGWERLKLYLEYRSELPGRISASYRAAVKRRRRGEPVAYITGTREFYGLSFDVNRHVLVPRPETELIVDLVLERLRVDGRPSGEGIYGIDLGTGSGNLAVTLAHLLPQAGFWAVDLSPRALRTAAANAARHGVGGRIRWCRGSYFQPLAAVQPPPRFNLIVANPPYISSDDLAGLPDTVGKYEPRLALDGGPDGLEGYRSLLADLPGYVRTPGLVALEIGSGQDRAVYTLCRELKLFRSLALHHDYQGLARVIMGLV